MQTFLPLPSFEDSAKVLDYRRLGKQRVEAWQIYLALQPESKSRWRNHPAVKMWSGYEGALLAYGLAICAEWIKRGYKDTLAEKFLAEFNKRKSSEMPKWFRNENFHASHRSNLLRKSKHYEQFGWKESKDLEYVWPVK